MKNKYGFTLIELLAVIVILAIIALIATPMILGIIDKAKKGSIENSTLGYIDAIEKYSILGMIDNKNNELTLMTGTYDVTSIELSSVEIKGEKPIEGWIQINSKGNIEEACIKFRGYSKYVHYKNNKAIANQDELCDKPGISTESNKYNNGTVVYFNPEASKKCLESEAVSTTGTKTGCMKWYTYNDIEGNTTVKMILDHNTTAAVAYNSTGVNTSMKELAISLTNDTATWNSSLNPNIITANEVAKITGNSTWNSTISNDIFYFDTNTATVSQTCKEGNITGCQYGWLYDRIRIDCTKYGCLNNADVGMTSGGYWTSSLRIINFERAWGVFMNGHLAATNVIDDYTYGLRPVITVSKNLIK